MHSQTLYTIMCIEDLAIVLFVFLYLNQIHFKRENLALYAFSRLLQAPIWAVYSIGFEQNWVHLGVRTALGFGIALESFCIVSASGVRRKWLLKTLLTLAGLSTILDFSLQSYPLLQLGLGNLLSGSVLLLAWALLAFNPNGTFLSKTTGWLLFSRGLLILTGTFIVDLFQIGSQEELKVVLNTIVASVTIFLPMIYLFLLKEKDDEVILTTNAELQKSNDAKEQLISIISHDLKNPLASMKNVLELIEEDSDINQCPNYMQYHELLRSSTDQSLQLLNNLVQWTLLKKTLGDVENSEVDLREVVKATRKLLTSELQKKNITLEEQYQSSTIIEINKLVVDCVIRNLLTNAIKFTHSEGRVILRTMKDDTHFKIEVEDNGVGMPKSKLNTLRESAKLSSTQGTMNETGSGLGLMICYELIRMNGYQMEIESEVGEGSIFRVLIPLLKKSGIIPHPQILSEHEKLSR